MKTHEISELEDSFKKLLKGEKTFLIMVKNCDYNVHDKILIKERNSTNGRYTEKSLLFEIVGISEELKEFGLPEWAHILSIKMCATEFGPDKGADGEIWE